jgi:hypothetical protein
MKNVRIFVLMIIFCAVAVLAFTFGLRTPGKDPKVTKVSNTARNTYNEPDPNDLRSQDLKEREKSFEAIRNQQRNLINELIRLAQEKVSPLPSSDPRFVKYPWHDSKHLSILLLGDLRAVESVPVLLENLEYKNPRTKVRFEPLDPGGLYPSAEVLSKIGMPAVGPVIDKLGRYGEQEEGHNTCCWIIWKILGPRLGKVRLEMAIEETKDDTIKKNLTAALPYFKTDKEKADEEHARREKAGKQGPLLKTEK